MVVRNGKIAAVGANVSVPSGVETFDANGGHVIPGIIDAHSHIAIEGGGNEGALAVSAMVKIGDVIHPDQIGIYRALAGGPYEWAELAAAYQRRGDTVRSVRTMVEVVRALPLDDPKREEYLAQAEAWQAAAEAAATEESDGS